MIWTQPSGPLCLWQCFYSMGRSPEEKLHSFGHCHFLVHQPSAKSHIPHGGRAPISLWNRQVRSYVTNLLNKTMLSQEAIRWWREAVIVVGMENSGDSALNDSHNRTLRCWSPKGTSSPSSSYLSSLQQKLTWRGKPLSFSGWLDPVQAAACGRR